jgi:transcriptional regulator with XRE-family HTH domain
LADYAIHRRGELKLRREDVAGRMGMSPKTVERIEEGKSVQAATLGKLERALRWKPGSARAVLEGGEPTLISPESDNSLYERVVRDEVEEEMLAIRGVSKSEKWAFVFDRRERLNAESTEKSRQGKQMGQTG